MTQNTSRRRFLKAAAATGAVAGLNATVLAQGQNEEYILLGGKTVGWQGFRLPGQATASASKNPTLNLQPGTTYTLLWRNMDGQPHNFAIQDSQGNNLPALETLSVDQSSQAWETLNQTSGNQTTTNVSLGNATGGNQTQTQTGGDQQLANKTDIVSEQGAVQGVRFTASQKMDSYICLVHPNTMVGEIQVGGTGGGSGSNNSSM
ncbi:MULTISPECIES: twin-arginine translocation signal domain-containing protein [Halorussus]|uniref:twin-arginine translocation signal domain-containing protein n=1 Tax=Halorussus TaxID=1070314 RepID=UPI00209EFC69|nr:twin-arginine translocation signal domain-containing protein [Halorussus vallis]USZ76625.1 twin-arginine translocation signal domain-containing protein [Halorussus vallis]